MKANPRILKFTGGLLLTVASLLAFTWYFWLAPWRKSYSVIWNSEHTARAQWIQYQKQLNRTGLNHDVSIAIGYYGDKRWMEWIVRTLKPVQKSYGCESGQMHLPDAPFKITNQRITKDTDWGTWWSTNKQKTQVEWVRDGFLQQGITLEQPLTTNNIVALLKLVATSKQNYLRYNAQRWLRDANVTVMPTAFDLTQVAPEDREEVTKGLVSYALWLGEHRDDPGKLAISGKDSDEGWRMEVEALLDRPPYNWLLKSCLLIMASVGVLLLRYARQGLPAANAGPSKSHSV